MIIDYNKKYDEDIKNLLEELQHYIASIDKEKYNIVSPDFKEYYFAETMKEVKENEGKIFLMQDDNKIVGLVVGLINNEAGDLEPGFRAPKRGRVTELIVTKEYRSKGYGKILLNKMETYLKEEGCQDILIGVFAYNESALKFYKRNGYHLRMTEVTKTNI